jgi:tetratricopeptide (TPR) repeat protein
MRNRFIQTHWEIATTAMITGIVLSATCLDTRAQNTGPLPQAPATSKFYQRPTTVTKPVKNTGNRPPAPVNRTVRKRTAPVKPSSQHPSSNPTVPNQDASSVPTKSRQLEIKELRSGGALDGRGKLWAVVIGVSDYKNLGPKDQLEFAHRDAADFADFLRSPNGGGFPSNQLTLLTNQGATLSAMRSALGTTLPRSVEPDDMVIIFFAGHGVVEGEGEGYLLAHDSDPQNLYATALQVSELNRIISERLKARTVILITDACHAGRLGWASRAAGESAGLVNRYLDEVGKSGRGVFRLLASRADQLSYEDKRFGGGHGCFTWFLLEGLRGKADRDSDGFVRMGELLEYLSEAVPNATQSLQHPRAAGDIDTRLPLAVLSTRSAKISENIASPLRTVTLELRGAPGTEIYLDNAFRGHVLPNGVLFIEQLKPGDHDLSLISRSFDPISQKVSLNAATTILNLEGVAAISPLVLQIRQTLKDGDISGAFDLYQKLVKESPDSPQRAMIEMTLSSAFEAIGQKAINAYVQSSGADLKRGMFHQAAEAYRMMKAIQPNVDREIEAKNLFCDGRDLIEELRFGDAVAQLNKATTLDPKAAYAYQALGQAYQGIKENDLALTAMNRAIELSPAWVLPRIQVGLIYREQDRREKAEEALTIAARLDPNNFLPHEELSRLYLKAGMTVEAEKQADQAISLGSSTGVSHLVRGEIYEKLKLWEFAADAYEKGMKLKSDLSEDDRKEYSKRLKKCRRKEK